MLCKLFEDHGRFNQENVMEMEILQKILIIMTSLMSAVWLLNMSSSDNFVGCYIALMVRNDFYCNLNKSVFFYTENKQG